MAAARRWALALGCILGCGPDEAREIARFEEVCGEPGPFRLLELEDDERLRSGSRKIGDRFYLIVGPIDAEPWPPDADDTRVVVTGPCGESPIEIARNISSVFEDERWPGRVFGCTAVENSDMVRLDPQGVEPARIVSYAPACRGTPTELGMVGVVASHDGTKSLLLAPYPSDLEEVGPLVTLVGTIRDTFFPDYLARGRTAYTVTPTHDLLRIDLEAVAFEVEQAGVAEWGVSADERTLAWRDVATHPDGDSGSIGTLTLRDRVDGHEATFAGVSLQSTPPTTYDTERLVLDVESEAGRITRIVDLPSFSSADFPGEHRFLVEVADGRLLMLAGQDGPLHLLDPMTGKETGLTELRAGKRSIGVDAIDLYVGATYDSAREAELWRVRYDGSGEFKLANRVTASFMIDLDGRIVTPLDLHDDGIGDLVTIDPESLHEELVDERVVVPLGPHGKTSGLHPREIVYGVVDGERSGVWIARLAP